LNLHIEFTEAAALDAEEARDWYETHRQGLGERFASVLKRVAEQISQFPEAAPEVRNGVRRIVLPVFNYLVYYRVEPERALIIGIRHPSRSDREFLDWI
jgi:plasmid stabilization system protein ParE